MTTRLKPGIRVDGSNRRDLNKDRVRDRMSGVTRDARSEAEIVEARSSRKQNRSTERSNVRRLRSEDGGKDGATLSAVELRISDRRVAPQIIRCRPGTFEWRYGRNKQGMLFHAGSQFAQLWERAGISVASSADFLRGTKAGYATGISNGRLAAIELLRKAFSTMGQATTDRLIAYCITGSTSAEIAAKWDVSERAMAAVLELDLKACAECLKFGA